MFMDMSNVVQNIDLSLIIPPKKKLMIDEEFQELVDSIRTSGILEPLLLRPRKEKYEIVIGNKRYEAAKLLGIKKVPSLVRNVDDDVINQYNTINNFEKNEKAKLQNSSRKFIPNENIERAQSTQSTNSQKISNNDDLYKKSKPNLTRNNFEDMNIKRVQQDIINLSELNQKEYERDDFNMNNTQINNNGINNNMESQVRNSQPQEPTFGGRFFPSLEDEPTNMNMGGINVSNVTTKSQNNNLIDLTDIGLEKTNQSQNLSPSNSQNQIEQSSQTNIYSKTNYSQGLQQEQLNPIPSPIENVINTSEASNLRQINHQNQNNISPVNLEQISQDTVQGTYNNTQNINQNPIEIAQNNIPYNQEFAAQAPQFDMSQNIAPTPQNSTQQLSNFQNIEQTVISQPKIQQNMSSEMQNYQLSQSQPIINQEIPPIIENSTSTNITIQKNSEVTINIIKDLVKNLGTLGYQINMNEENLPNSIKLTIEVEK